MTILQIKGYHNNSAPRLLFSTWFNQPAHVCLQLNVRPVCHVVQAADSSDVGVNLSYITVLTVSHRSISAGYESYSYVILLCDIVTFKCDTIINNQS